MGIRSLVFSLALASASLSGATAVHTQDGTAPNPNGSPISTVFETRAPGSGSGGISIGTDRLHGHSFRLLERTQITALGVDRLSLPAGQSVFVALYQIDTADSVPDVVNDSNLLTAALIEGPVSTAEASAAVSLTVDPGIYAIAVGTGRHGATAGHFQASLDNTGTTTSQYSYGPYNVDYSSGARTLQGSSTRLFVEGQSLPAETPDPNAFLMETARPSAWWGQQSYPISPTSLWYASPFEITRPTRIDQVGSWLRSGSGDVFAAIVELSGPGAKPLPVTHPGFANSLKGTALIQTGSAPATYTGSFAGLELPPGHYALILGSGEYGANGSASVMMVADQIIQPTTLAWSGTFWGNTNISFRKFLNGHMPDLAVSPDPVNFGQTLVGQVHDQIVTLSNLRDTDLEMSGIGVSNPVFSLGADVNDCSVTTLGPGQSCQFTVHAHPAMRGPFSAELRLWSDGEPSPLIVELSGEGVAPVIDFSPASFEFELLRGSQASQNLNLENIGDPGQDLVWELEIAPDSSCNAPGTPSWLIATPDSGSIASGQNEAIAITADASGLAAGSLELVLCLSSNDPFSSQLTVPVSLEVTAPSLAFDPGALDFGPGEVNAGLIELAASLENSGDGEATGLNFSFSGDDHFTIVTESCGSTLAAGASCQLDIGFQPDEFGDFAGQLSVTNGQDTAPAELGLSGSGFVPISPDANGILYVDRNVSGGNQSGSSWTHALPELNAALDWAADDWDPLDGELQIWVAQGSYTPADDPTDLQASFVLVDGVALYGGFAGTETSLDERDWNAFPTLLSGQIGAANVHHVLRGDNLDSGTLIDGFTILDGWAQDNGGPDSVGGGLYLVNSSLVISNTVFTANRAARAGGAVFLYDGSEALFVNVLFEGNQSIEGGAVSSNGSHASYLNCLFYANIAHNPANQSGFGGGINNSINSSLEAINTIFWANTSDIGEAQIHNYTTDQAVLSHSIIEGGIPNNTDDGGNNRFDDPRFVDADSGNFNLERESPAVNAGDPTTDLDLFFGGSDEPLDLAGLPRVFAGLIETIDIGPFELQDDPPLPLPGFDPQTLDFGEIELDTGTATLQAELRNDGDAAVTGLGFTLGGDPGFSLVTDDCGSELGAGQSCQVEIGFLPAAIGPFSGQLTLSGAEFTAQAELDFSGNGTQAALELTPAVLDFGEVAVGTTSPTASITLTSTGSAPLRIETISPTAPPFVSSGGDCGPLPIELDPGQSCETGVAFSPTAMGEASAALSIESNAISSPDTLQLAGQGVAALIDIQPTSFALTLSRGQNASRSLAIGNPGTLDLHWTITAESSCGSGPDTTWLTINPASGSSTPQQSSTVEIDIASADLPAGSHHTALCIASNALGQTLLEIPLELQVTAAELVFDPATLDFGEVETDSTSAPQPITLHNQGDAAADELTISVPASFSADTSACPQSLAADAHCIISVRFAPTQTGTVQASLTASSAHTSSVTAELTGTGTRPEPTEDHIFSNRFELAPAE